MHDSRNGLTLEVKFEAMLHFVEVEQLIDEFQEPMGIAVDDIQVVGRPRLLFLHQLLQRSDDQRDRRAYLVGDHREEAQARLTHLGGLLFAEPLHLALVTTLGTAQSELSVIINKE